MIIDLEDSGQPVRGIQPKNYNNGKAQMIVILIASMCFEEILCRLVEAPSLRRVEFLAHSFENN